MRKCESLEPLQLTGYSRLTLSMLIHYSTESLQLTPYSQLTRGIPIGCSTKLKKEHSKSSHILRFFNCFSSEQSSIHQEVKTQCLQCCFYCCFRYFHQHLVNFNWHVKGYRLSTHSSLDPPPQLMYNIYSTIRQNPPCFAVHNCIILKS